MPVSRPAPSSAAGSPSVASRRRAVRGAEDERPASACCCSASTSSTYLTRSINIRPRRFRKTTSYVWRSPSTDSAPRDGTPRRARRYVIRRRGASPRVAGARPARVHALVDVPTTPPFPIGGTRRYAGVRRGLPNAALDALHASASKRLDFLGRSMAGLFAQGGARNSILKALINGATVRVVFLDPTSPSSDQVRQVGRATRIDLVLKIEECDRCSHRLQDESPHASASGEPRHQGRRRSGCEIATAARGLGTDLLRAHPACRRRNARVAVLAGGRTGRYGADAGAGRCRCVVRVLGEGVRPVLA